MPLTVLLGDSSATRRAAQQRIVSDFVAQEGDMNLSKLENPSSSELMNICETAPFLGTSRLVVVTEFHPKQAHDALIAFLGSMPAHCQLVFSLASLDARTSFAKALKKHGDIQLFEAPKPAAFPAWVQSRARELGIQIEPRAAQLLADYTHGSTDIAESELHKLASSTGSAIQIADVEALTPPSPEASVFELSDAIGQRRTRDALTLLGQMVDRGESLMQIMFMIVRHLRILLSIHAARAAGTSDAQLPQALKLHPFVAKKSAAQARSFSADELQRALAVLLRLDRQIKSGHLHISSTDQRELALGLEQLIVGMSK